MQPWQGPVTDRLNWWNTAVIPRLEEEEPVIRQASSLNNSTCASGTRTQLNLEPVAETSNDQPF